LFLLLLRPLSSTLFPYTTLFRSHRMIHIRLPRLPLLSGMGLFRKTVCFFDSLNILFFQIGGTFVQQLFNRHHKFTWNGQKSFFRSEEHTSELQSRENLVCRLLLE